MKEYKFTKTVNAQGHEQIKGCDNCRSRVPLTSLEQGGSICQVCFELQPATGLFDALAIITNILRTDVGAFGDDDTDGLVLGEVLNGAH